MHLSWLKTLTSLLALASSAKLSNAGAHSRSNALRPSAQANRIDSTEQMLMSRTYRRQAQTLTDLQIRSSANRNERSPAGNSGAAALESRFFRNASFETGELSCDFYCE